MDNIMLTETLSHWLSKQREFLCITLLPNILVAIRVILCIHYANIGFNGGDLIVLIVISLIYLAYYSGVFLMGKRYQYFFCTPCASIFMTILSILIWILFMMRLFNIIGFRILGLRERNWDTIYKDICGCTCNPYEREFNKYTKYLEWYIN